jgi:LDH2 family malate/lactate/ureidoglycolate dehydrogenase
MVRLKEEPLRKLSFTLFEAVGAPEDEAKIVSDILVDTSIHGVDSHGVRAIPGYIRGIQLGPEAPRALVPGTPIKTLVDTPTTAMWDADKGFGFVAGYKAMSTAIEKAKKYKMGSVGIKGTGHIGALYWYSYLAARNNMIGLTLCRGGGHSVAPYGGVEGRLGVNPLCFSIPAGKYRPIILDMATTGVAMGHLLVMAIRGQSAPEGWLIKPDGTWATDPGAIRKREAQPVGFGHPYSEYKGYGLSIIVEALAGAIGSGCSLDETGFGHTFTAIDPTGYCPLDEFTGRIDSMIDHLKSSKKRPGFDEILYSGEPEWREEDNRRKLGILVDDPFWEAIVKTAKELNVDIDGIMKDGYVKA